MQNKDQVMRGEANLIMTRMMTRGLGFLAHYLQQYRACVPVYLWCGGLLNDYIFAPASLRVCYLGDEIDQKKSCTGTRLRRGSWLCAHWGDRGVASPWL
ncbi:conserved protein of unknown function [Pseudomonas marincola]|uniref:Uncharacterized protein n=1 Tax=Pseudomonas marincola TaxID=437900 RepID=A0A653E9I8_9PSED|nr:conserved protein of unknown function [Pseudomonas marincola]